MSLNIRQILANEPKYRLKQIEKASFDVNLNSYEEITTLPLSLREQLKNIPWLSVKLQKLFKSKLDSTEKALLELNDGSLLETVLLGRENLKETRETAERQTICISTQVGCPMGCVFCATGKAGFKRNLTVEEIVDQHRFWDKYLSEKNIKKSVDNDPWGPGKNISNIVVMGQGEPLLNYENLKEALKIILENSEIGPTKITVSTCGVPEQMEKIIEDKDFPQVRWAVSLHSAIEETRKKIMPSHRENFLKFLVQWSEKYHREIPSRTHFIGLEYLLLSGVNDDEKQLLALEKLARKIPRVRINLIPFNDTDNPNLDKSSKEKIEQWHNYLMQAGFICTIRRSQGQDISAACGQLCNKNNYEVGK